MLATTPLIRRIRKSTTTDRPPLEFNAVKKIFQKNSARGEPLGCWIVYRFAVVTGSTAV